MKRRRKDKQAPVANPRISARIWEFAGDFIRAGPTQEQREIRLNAASSAWNIAASPSGRRGDVLDGYLAKYLEYNPQTDPARLAAIRKDMEALVERKLKLFPSDLRQIVSARLVRVGENDRIEAVAATFE